MDVVAKKRRFRPIVMAMGVLIWVAAFAQPSWAGQSEVPHGVDAVLRLHPHNGLSSRFSDPRCFQAILGRIVERLSDGFVIEVPRDDSRPSSSGRYGKDLFVDCQRRSDLSIVRVVLEVPDKDPMNKLSVQVDREFRFVRDGQLPGVAARIADLVERELR